RLVVFGLCRRPLVSGGVVARDAVEKARQHSEGGLRTGVLDRRLDERPTRFGLAEPERAHHEPGQEPRIRLQLRGALGELDAASAARPSYPCLTGPWLAAIRPRRCSIRTSRSPLASTVRISSRSDTARSALPASQAASAAANRSRPRRSSSGASLAARSNAAA